MSQDPEERASDLLRRGYVEVATIDGFSVHDRVRHYNEQYAEAYRSGTGTIERIFHRPNRSFERRWGCKDVEVIVKRDKPRFGPEDTHAFVAQYHITGVIE
jgi:hypothetical protein